MLKKWRLKVKKSWLPYLFAYTAKMCVKMLLRTCRIEVRGLDEFNFTAKQAPCILMLWHNRLVIVSEILNAFTTDFIYTAFISKSRDGEPLALLAQSYKRGRVLRVPHNARHRALNQMIEQLKEKKEIMLVTPDGPRGPRYTIKPGIVMAAREASAQIIPFSWQASRQWVLKTWDLMMIPKPFSKIYVTFGSPIALNQEKQEPFEEAAELLKAALMDLEKDKR